MGERKPDKQDIEEYATFYRNLWTLAHSNWAEYDRFYWRDFDIWAGIDEKAKLSRPKFHPSTPASIVDHAADNQMSYSPSVKRPTYGSNDANEERDASVIERFVAAVFRDSGLKEPVFPYKQMGKYLLHYGYAVQEGPILELSSKPKVPEKQKGETEDDFSIREENYASEIKTWNPFRLHAPHPATVLADPMEKEPEIALKQSERIVRDLIKLSVEKSRTRKDAVPYEIPKGKRAYDRESIIEYWSREWHAVMVAGGALLYVEKNIYGFNPIVHAFAGFGQQFIRLGSPMDAASAGTPLFDPRYLAVGLLEHVMDSVRVQAQNFSARHNLLVEASFPPRGTTQEAETAARAIGEGGIVEGRKEDFWVMDTPQATRWMFEVGAEVDRDIEAGSYASHIAGIREEGVSTVGQQQILTTQANKKFVAPANQLEELATICGQRILRLAKVLGKLTDIRELSIRGNTIKPSDIKHYALEVRFELLDPVIDLQRRELGLREVQLGVKSDTTYREMDSHISDEYQERRRLIEQRLRQRPEVMAAEEKIISQEEGLKEVLEAYQARQQEEAMLANQPSRNRRGGLGSATRPLRQPLTGQTVKPAPAQPNGGQP